MAQNFSPDPNQSPQIVRARTAELAAAAQELEVIVSRGGDEHDLQQFLSTHAYFVLICASRICHF